MDVATIETNLPAAVITAATSAGLVSGKVYLARDRRTGDQATDPECWIQPIGRESAPNTLSRDGVAYRYRLHCYRAGPTLAQRRALVDLIAGYFHGFRRTGATRLDHWEAQNLELDPHLEEGPDGAVSLDLVAIGEGEEETV